MCVKPEPVCTVPVKELRLAFHSVTSRWRLSCSPKGLWTSMFILVMIAGLRLGNPENSCAMMLECSSFRELHNKMEQLWTVIGVSKANLSGLSDRKASTSRRPICSASWRVGPPSGVERHHGRNSDSEYQWEANTYYNPMRKHVSRAVWDEWSNLGGNQALY